MITISHLFHWKNQRTEQFSSHISLLYFTSLDLSFQIKSLYILLSSHFTCIAHISMLKNKTFEFKKDAKSLSDV